MTLKFKGGKYPGQEYMKVICDVCRGEFYRKDTVLVKNKYNFQYGQVVCFKDLDEINEQVLPNKSRDRPVKSPETLRPPKDPVFDVNENDDRLPSAPRAGYTQPHPLNNTIDLFWQGPEDSGSSGIIGYKIARATPQLSSYTVIDADTETGATYYSDLTADVTLKYSYKVAAINSFGVGSYSIDFFWPYNDNPDYEAQYLVISPAGDTLEVNGVPVRMNHI